MNVTFVQAHKFITDEIRAKLPPLYATEEIGIETQALVKYFTPDSSWTWYASEASALLDDGTYKRLSEVNLSDSHIADVIFFGLVSGFEVELGYFLLSELMGTTGKLSLHIERDLYYHPKTLRELQEQHRRERHST